MSSGEASFTERELLEETAWMRRLARALVRDADGAEDLVQEAWVAALESGGGARRGPPRSWLAAVLRNRASTERRARGRRADRERRAARPEGLPAADEALQRVELQERVARAVLALEEPYRRTIALRFFAGWPPRRIARALELDARTVEGRLRRGLEHLRRQLDAQHGGRREEWLGGMAVLGLGTAKPWAPLLTGLGLVALVSVAVVASGRVGAREPEPPRAPSAVLASVQDGLAQDGLVRQGPNRTGPETPEPAGRARAALPGSGARVTFLRAGDDLPLADTAVAVGGESLATDGEGVLELGWPEGTRSRSLRIVATATTREFDHFLDAPGEHVVRVPRRGGRLEGQVVDIEGRPVARAELRLFDHLGFGHSVEWDAPGRTARADGEGRFSVADLADPRGRIAYWKVLASAPGQFSAFALGGQLDGNATARVLLVTEPVTWVPGRVSAWDRGRVPGIELLAWQPDHEAFERAEELFERWREAGPPSEARGRPPWDRPERGFAVELRSDQAGEFRMPVAAGGRRLQVDCGNYPLWIEQVEADTPLVEVHLEGGVALAGRVLDEHGRAVPGADIALHCLETREGVRADAAGRFRFEALSPLEGAWVAVAAEGHGCAVAPVDLVGREVTVVVELERERIVSGRLVDAEGRPVDGRRIDLRGDRIVATAWQPRHSGRTWEQYAPGPRPSWFGYTDVEGRFEFRRLYPGRFRIRADDAGEGVTWAEMPEGIEQVVVEGSTEGAVTVRGTFATAAGGDPGPVSVLLSPFVEGEDRPASDPRGGTFAGGRYELSGLDPGRWRIEARTLDGGASHVGEVRPLAPGEHVVDVVLEPWR